jgi:hypothetical protein
VHERALTFLRARVAFRYLWFQDWKKKVKRLETSFITQKIFYTSHEYVAFSHGKKARRG